MAKARDKKKDSKSTEQEISSHDELFARVRKVMEEEVRPYFMSHGGDFDIVEFDADKKLHLRLHGACGSCPASSMTLYYVVEEALEAEFPDDGIEVVQVFEDGMALE